MVEISCSEYVRGKQTESTRQQYILVLKKFFKLVDKTLPEKPTIQELDDASVRYLQSKPNLRKDLLDFRDHIEHLAPKTRAVIMIVLLNYLETNEIVLPKSLRNDLKIRGVEAISEEFIPTNHDLSRLCEYLPLLGRAITLTLSSSGVRIGECLALKMDDIDTKHTPVKVNIIRKNTKNKHRRFTFISGEADNSIKEWLSYRDEWLKTTQARSTNYQIRDDEKLFPISEGSFKDMWTRALIKCGLAKRDKETRRLTMHPHSLRKYFRTRGGWTNPDIPEALMGHQAGITAIYARFDQAEDILSKEYLEAEKHLSITVGAQTISDLQKRVTKQSDDITQLVTNLSLRNAKLENELNQVKADMTKFVDLVQNDSTETIKDLSERLAALEERDKKLSEIEFENSILTQ